MPYRYYEATHHELDPNLGEYSRLEWAQGIPVVGELVPMGSDRFWEVVAVDEFRLEEQTPPEARGRPRCVSQPLRFARRGFTRAIALSED